MAYQKAKMLIEMRRDMEAMTLSENPAVAGNSTTPSKSSALGSMVYTNVSSGVGGSTPAHISGAQLVAHGWHPESLHRTVLKDVVGMVYTNSSDMPEIAVMSRTTRRCSRPSPASRKRATK